MSEVKERKWQKENIKRIIDEGKKRKRDLFAKRKKEGQCNAIICHGPGHQSRTFCQVKGKHKIHRAIYGSYNQEAKWKEDEICSGYFDESPR